MEAYSGLRILKLKGNTFKEIKLLFGRGWEEKLQGKLRGEMMKH